MDLYVNSGYWQTGYAHGEYAYYVEPDYWVAGYVNTDTTQGFIFGYGKSDAQSAADAASQYTAGSQSGCVLANSEIDAGPNITVYYPGVNLNALGTAVTAGNAKISSIANLITAQSTTKASGRIFWENTSPASGAWTVIVPQAEGAGK